MRRSLPLSLLLLSLALTPSAVAALDVAPGTTSPTLEAEGCIAASGSFTGACLAGCAAGCVLDENSAEAYVDVTNYTVGKKFAEATAYSDFTVTTAADGAANGVDANISYDVSWAGGWTVTGAFTGWNDAQTNITLTLTDLTNGGAVVRSVNLHQMEVDGFIGIDLIDVGFGLDSGESVNSMSARLTRGHTYRLALKIRNEAKGAANAIIILDYQTGGWGARWNDLKVSIAPDLVEEIEKLKQRVAALENHTHTYLTGRGVGHNNAEAETSTPILVEDDSTNADETELMASLTAGKDPLPLPTVIVRNSPNPGPAGTTISFTLPEALPVTISLYDVRGQLARTLLSEFRAAGTHDLEFDAGTLPAGVYFYRLTAGPFSESRKLTLLR